MCPSSWAKCEFCSASIQPDHIIPLPGGHRGVVVGLMDKQLDGVAGLIEVVLVGVLQFVRWAPRLATSSRNCWYSSRIEPMTFCRWLGGSSQHQRHRPPSKDLLPTYGRPVLRQRHLAGVQPSSDLPFRRRCRSYLQSKTITIVSTIEEVNNIYHGHSQGR